jgi:hypothetical protein
MKAQFWSFDAIFAMVIFSSALLIITFVWISVSNQFSLAYGMGLQTMQAQLQSLQAQIVTPGVPADWNAFVNVSNTITWKNLSIGLGTGSGSSLSLSKIMTLMSMSGYSPASYQATKTLLGVGYDYYIVINGTSSTMTMGLPPYNLNPYAIQVARQSAVLNGVPVRVQVIVWTNKSFGVS